MSQHKIEGTTMKRTILGLAAVVSVAMGTACSDASLRQAGPSAGGQQFELRVLGVSPGANTWVSARVVDVAIEGNGMGLAFTPGTDQLDLGDGSQAWLVGRFVVPPDVQNVKATLQLDDFGAFETAQGGGWIDLRDSPITVDLSTAQMTRNGRAVIQLNVDQMLSRTNRPDEDLAVRNLRVVY
jgi:hypothetical protein